MAHSVDEAVGLVRAGDFSRAMAVAREMLANDPAHPVLIEVAAYSAANLDLIDDAAGFYLRLAELPGTDAAALIRIKDFLISLGRLGDAARLLESGRRRFAASVEVMSASAEYCGWLGDMANAIAWQSRAVALRPADAALATRLAEFRQSQQQRDAMHASADAIGRVVAERHGDRVASGPFAGMRYQGRSEFGWPAHLLGCYEEEIHFPVEALIAREPAAVINIGAAGGFYAVGLAMRLPRARVYAYEIDESLHAEIRRGAEINGVADRIVVGGRFEAGDFAKVADAMPAGRVLVLSDCEGCELDLLRPAAVPMLRSADLLVECHDPLVANVTPTLLRRFCDTHRIMRVGTIANEFRSTARFEALAAMSPADRARAVSDYRGVEMGWLMMTAR